MTLLTSILQRQLVPSPVRRALPVDFALEAFTCIKDDEHLVERREIDVPPFACRFNKTALGGHMLAIADEDGWVQILDSRKTGKRSIIKEWNAHENAVFDIAWMEGEQMLVTASGDQTIRMWDVNRDQCLAVFKGHSCSVKSVDFREDEIFVFATGARDGNVMVWDMRCNRRPGHFYQPINVISNAHFERLPGTRQMSKKKSRRSTSRPVMNSSQQSVTAVLFQGGEKLISAGAVDGKIKIWDLRKTYTNLKNDPVPFHIFPYPGQGVRKHGFSSLVLDSTHSRLFAGCTNDQIYMYSCTSLGQEPLGTFSGHLNSTFYVKSALSPNDMYLLSGSSDNNAYIWKVSEPTAPPIVLKGHLGEVTSVAWCPSDQGKVVTCSDDNSFRIWRINHQACKNDRLNLIGESCKLALQTSVSPVNDKISASRFQDRTPSSSPSTSPDAKRLLWTPPSKLITNPRFNQISSPVGMATRLNSPTNRTPPQKQNLLTQSPKATMSPPNLKTGLTAHAMHDAKMTTTPSFVSSSLTQPFSPECLSSQVSSPKSPAVIKYQSPKQLLASWLRTNSRKRRHSDSVDTTDETNNSVKSELTLSDKIEKNLGDKEKTFVSHNLLQEHGNKENNISGQKCLATSPLRKRRCSSDPLNSTTHNSREIKVKPNSSPGKENHVVDQGSMESSKQEERSASLGKNCNKPVTVKVKNQVSVGERQKNWLTEWSDHCKAKNRGKTIDLQGGEYKDSNETMNFANEEKRDNLQATTAQVAEVPKPGRSILTYFKHDVAS